MKAMILAAGEGTRIREVTEGKIPKPMVDLGDGPLIEHTVNKLVDFGVEEIIINLHHRGDKIKGYFGNEWEEVPITYSEEKDLLGTAGAIKKVENRLNEDFLLVYGDILTDLNLEKFLKYHKEIESDTTVLTYRQEENLTEASIILKNQENEITQFIEKPSESVVEKFKDRSVWTNGAVFIMDPSILNYIPDGQSDLSDDIFPKLVESENFKFKAHPLPENTYWQEVGNPERYRKVRKDIQNGKIDFRN